MSIESGSLLNSVSVVPIRENPFQGITKYTPYGFSYYLTKRFFIEAEKNRVLRNPKILKFGLRGPRRNGRDFRTLAKP